MQQSMSYWGPDGSGEWRNGSVGLGHLMLYNTPQSPYETSPLHSKSDGIVITASARLDNRVDLFQALGITPSEQSSMPDNLLILKAYQKWGEDCTQHLLGDWSFALWDSKKRKLFLARDHFGVTSLYYLHLGHTFIFASSLKGLLSLPIVPRKLNQQAIACFAPGYLHDTETPYQDIFRLAPSHTLSVTKNDIQLKRYWQMEDVPEIRYHSDQEYLDHFLEIYREAVDCRLRSFRPIGTQLSGGLDSSSIAVLAAQNLASSDKRLPAFCSVPLYDIKGYVATGRSGDESISVKMIAEMAGNIDVNFVKSEDSSPLAGIKHIIDILEQPIGAANNTYWLLDILQAAQQQGVGTVLSGWGGNLTVSWTGDRREYLRQLIKDKHLGKYIYEIAAWRKNNSDTLLHTLTSQILKPLLPTSWETRYHLRKATEATSLNMPLADALAADFKRDKMTSGSALDGLNLFFQNGSVGSIDAELGAAFGLEVRQPTMDKRLIEFCLGIPQDQYTHDGNNKLLIRNAMQGMLPEQVLWSKQRGLQAADISQRILASSVEIEAALTSFKSSRLARKFLDLDTLTNSYQAINNKVNRPTYGQSNILLRGIMLGTYLQRFDEP